MNTRDTQTHTHKQTNMEDDIKYSSLLKISKLIMLILSRGKKAMELMNLSAPRLHYHYSLVC